MIKLGDRPSKPDVLSELKIESALSFLKDQLEKNGKLSFADFKNKRHWGKVKKDLWEYQNKKCCFCERQRDSNRESDVEHFRPKLESNGEPAPGHKGYWWLAYDWKNLFFACSDCNSGHKKNFFPLIAETDRALYKGDDLLKERPYLLNPELDDPEEFIAYDYTNDKTPYPVGKDPEGRGEKTIEILGLRKRTGLITDRAEKLVDMELCARAIIRMEDSERDFGNSLDQSIRSLKSHVSSKSKFAGFSRFFYRQMGLREHVPAN